MTNNKNLNLHEKIKKKFQGYQTICFEDRLAEDEIE